MIETNGNYSHSFGLVWLGLFLGDDGNMNLDGIWDHYDHHLLSYHFHYHHHLYYYYYYVYCYYVDFGFDIE